MEKTYCTKCNGTAVKNGFQGKMQRYKCKSCQKKFQLDFAYKAYAITINDSIVVLLKEGCGIRSIARILGISKNTVLARIISIGKTLKAKPLLQKGCSYEMDGIWTFIGKKNAAWITYAIERKSKSVVGFVLGSKNER